MLFKRLNHLSSTTALHCCCMIPQRDVHPEPQNVTLFGIVFVDAVRVRTLRWAHPGWGWTLNLMTSPEKRRRNQWDTRGKETMWRQSRDWSYKDPSQEYQPLLAASEAQRRAGNGFSRGSNLVHTLLLHLKPLELWENRFLLGLPSNPVVKTLPSKQEVQVQSLVGELRSHVPHGQKTQT